MIRVTVRGLAARRLRLALTALAIVIGVTFVAGTLVLGDTLDRTFDRVVGNVYAHVSFEVRGRSAFGDSQDAGIAQSGNRSPLPESLAGRIRALPGVADARGSVDGYAQFVTRNGQAIGNGGSSALGFSFDPDARLSPLHLVSGHAPDGPGEVVMDEHTAHANHFAPGDSVRVLLPHGHRVFRISGLVTFGGASSLVGTTLAGFQQSTAQSLFGDRGTFDSINVLARPNADNVALQRSIGRLLPRDAEVVSGKTVQNELSTTVDNDLSFISTALLIFAAIALLVGAFTIFNTFSITVGQRTRELALLRVVGAGRRQLLASVLGEAAVTGLVASLAGLGLGVVAALGLKALLGSFGINLPSAPLVFKARTAVVAIAVGLGVTVLSAIVPARRAVKIPPIAALGGARQESFGPVPRRRLIAGAALTAIGVLLLIGGLHGAAPGTIGFAGLALLIATVLFVPAIARPLAGALGTPLAALCGTPGRLGRENAMRSPRRTSQTSGALMMGLALVAAIAVLGDSLSTSAKRSVDSAISAGYIIGGSGAFSDSVPGAVSALPGVQATTNVYRGQFEIRGSQESLAAVTPTGIGRTIALRITSGRGAAALTGGELLVDSDTAAADHLHVGSAVPVTFARTGTTHLRIGGIYAENPLAGSYIVGDRLFLAHFGHSLLDAVLVRAAPGTHHFEATLNHALHAYPNLSIQSRAQFEHSQQQSVNKLLGLIYVLLALAVLVALIGIINTLMLSVFERTREIGLLRAVGMQRRQIRTMIRSESVIVALFGAVVGIIGGGVLGAALASSLRHQGVTTVAIPVGSLILFLVIAASLGLLAASWPARRAARLNVLGAISTE